MSKEITDNAEKDINYWVGGASWDNGKKDKTEDFIKGGIWKNGYKDGKYFEKVNKVKKGDKFALKSKRITPSKPAILIIKAIGTVVKNLGDGRNLEINWGKKYEEPFELEMGKPLTIHKIEESNEIKIIFNDLIHNYKEILRPNKILKKKQIILYGPPGTGKTYITKEIAVQLLEAK